MIGEILSVTFITGLIGAMMRMATPIIFAMLGEIITERAGVLNLGIEGIMLMGAMTGFLVTLSTGSLWTGVFAAALALLASGCGQVAARLGPWHHSLCDRARHVHLSTLLRLTHRSADRGAVFAD